MKGEGITINSFEDKGIRLEVPFFQRPYVWDEEDWQTLLDNILGAPEGKMPFLGSLILQKIPRCPKRYYIIDGQQRLITLSILIHIFLIRYFPRENLSSFSEQMLANRTWLRSFLYSAGGKGEAEEVTRITPSHADHDAFEHVFFPSLAKIDDSKITLCADFFKEKLAESDEATLSSIYSRLISKDGYLIAIWLDDEDDEQEIFDTVNSLGKRLANSDIIKNYLFQAVKNKCDERVALDNYHRFWEPTFLSKERRPFWDASFSSGRYITDNLDSFLKCYAIIKGIYDATKRGGVEGLAKRYKEYIDGCNGGELKVLVHELCEYATSYFEIKSHYQNCDDYRMSDVLSTTLLVMDKLDYTTFDPYILKIHIGHDADENNKLIELQRFVLKRFLWEATTKDYNKLCASLLKNEDPSAVLRRYNAQTTGVSWDAFPPRLSDIDNKSATLVLFLCELISRKDTEDLLPFTLKYNLTLEHIMPIKWQKHWSEVPCFCANDDGQFELITDEEEVKSTREKAICSIGNMLLLTDALNRKVSNLGFAQKVEGDAKNKGIGFYAQNLHIAEDVIATWNRGQNWDERSIRKREENIFRLLDGYYRFSDSQVSDETVEFFESGVPNSADDPYFARNKVGKMVQECFHYLVQEDKLTEESVGHLLRQDYSSEVLGMYLPVLIPEGGMIRDSYGHYRYYKESFTIRGKNYFLCSQWQERNRGKFIKWFLEIAKNGILVEGRP